MYMSLDTTGINRNIQERNKERNVARARLESALTLLTVTVLIIMKTMTWRKQCVFFTHFELARYCLGHAPT